jgi:hypothetical protein
MREARGLLEWEPFLMSDAALGNVRFQASYTTSQRLQGLTYFYVASTRGQVKCFARGWWAGPVGSRIIFCTQESNSASLYIYQHYSATSCRIIFWAPTCTFLDTRLYFPDNRVQLSVELTWTSYFLQRYWLYLEFLNHLSELCKRYTVG